MDRARNTDALGVERSAFILALALLMGVPPERNYYHMAAFEPRMLDSNNGARTQGLGSGYSDYAKDCGCVGRVPRGQDQNECRVIYSAL